MKIDLDKLREAVELMRVTGRCRDAQFLGTGILGGYRLLFKGMEPDAYATIERWSGFQVPFVLWEISAADEVALDRYEGYPSFYGKRVVQIEFGGEKMLAMFYAKDEELAIGQPMTHYVEVLEEAYKKFKFDRAILDEALRLSDEDYQRRMTP